MLRGVILVALTTLACGRSAGATTGGTGGSSGTLGGEGGMTAGSAGTDFSPARNFTAGPVGIRCCSD